MKAISKENTNEKVSGLKKMGRSKESIPSEDRADDPFQYWVEKTRKALGTKPDGSEYSFGQICGVISNWGNKKQKIRKLKRRYHECKKADIPFSALWWWKRSNNN